MCKISRARRVLGCAGTRAGIAYPPLSSDVASPHLDLWGSPTDPCCKTLLEEALPGSMASTDCLFKAFVANSASG